MVVNAATFLEPHNIHMVVQCWCNRVYIYEMYLYDTVEAPKEMGELMLWGPVVPLRGMGVFEKGNNIAGGTELRSLSRL